jgi:hypothetical protein
MKHKQYFDQLQALRDNVVKDIKEALESKNAYSVRLKSPIIHEYIDKNTYSVISEIRSDGSVILDLGYTTKDKMFDSISLIELVHILMSIEEDHFTIDEEA